MKMKILWETMWSKHEFKRLIFINNKMSTQLKINYNKDCSSHLFIYFPPIIRYIRTHNLRLLSISICSPNRLHPINYTTQVGGCVSSHYYLVLPTMKSMSQHAYWITACLVRALAVGRKLCRNGKACNRYYPPHARHTHPNLQNLHTSESPPTCTLSWASSHCTFLQISWLGQNQVRPETASQRPHSRGNSWKPLAQVGARHCEQRWRRFRGRGSSTLGSQHARRPPSGRCVAHLALPLGSFEGISIPSPDQFRSLERTFIRYHGAGGRTSTLHLDERPNMKRGRQHNRKSQAIL